MVKFNEDEQEMIDLNSLADESAPTALIVPQTFTDSHTRIAHDLIAQAIDILSRPNVEVNNYSINDYGSFVDEALKIKLGKHEISLGVRRMKGEF